MDILWCLPIAVVGGLIFLIILRRVIRYSQELGQMHSEVLAYLYCHHPEVAPRMELVRTVGGLYPTGAFRPSIIFAREHEPLGDPVAEELLADYAQLADQPKRYIVVFLAILLVLLVAQCLYNLVSFLLAIYENY